MSGSTLTCESCKQQTNLKDATGWVRIHYPKWFCNTCLDRFNETGITAYIDAVIESRLLEFECQHEL